MGTSSVLLPIKNIYDIFFCLKVGSLCTGPSHVTSQIFKYCRNYWMYIQMLSCAATMMSSLHWTGENLMTCYPMQRPSTPAIFEFRCKIAITNIGAIFEIYAGPFFGEIQCVRKLCRCCTTKRNCTDRIRKVCQFGHEQY